MNSIEMRQERAKLITDARKLVDHADAETRDMSSEENQQWDRMNAEIDRLGREVDKAERREHITALETDMKDSVRKAIRSPIDNRGRPDQKASSQAFRGFLKQQVPDRCANAEERAAMELMGIPTTGSISLKSNKRAQSPSMTEGTATSGAELFTYYNIADYLDTATKYYGDMLQTSKVFETENAYPFPLPTANDTSNQAAIIGENATISALDSATAKVTFGAWKFTTAVWYSVEILDDALFNLEAWLGDQLGVRFGRALNDYFVVGTGTSQPTGITVGATDSGIVLAGSSGSVPTWTGDSLISLVYAVDRSYRQKGSFLMHDSTLATVRKLKDSNGQYLYQIVPGFSGALNAGEPDRILNYPVHVNNAMPVGGSASGAVLMCFGDLSKYHVRRVRNVGFQRLQELGAMSGQLGLVAWCRYDGALVDAGLHPVKAILNP